MKQIFKLALAGFLSVGMFQAKAQNAMETSVDFKKDKHNAVVATYEVPKDMLEAALKQRLDKDNLGKMKKSDGFITYSAVIWNVTGNVKMDLYFKVDGSKNKSTISVLASKGYDNFVSSNTDADIINNLKTYLNGFTDVIGAYKLSLEIKAQEDLIQKTEKDYGKVTDKTADLEKQKLSLEQKITEQKNLQAHQQTTLNAAKAKLTEMKTRVK